MGLQSEVLPAFTWMDKLIAGPNATSYRHWGTYVVGHVSKHWQQPLPEPLHEVALGLHARAPRTLRTAWTVHMPANASSSTSG